MQAHIASPSGRAAVFRTPYLNMLVEYTKLVAAPDDQSRYGRKTRADEER